MNQDAFNTEKSHTIYCPKCNSQQTAFIKYLPTRDPDKQKAYIKCVNYRCEYEIEGKELDLVLAIERLEINSYG